MRRCLCSLVCVAMAFAFCACVRVDGDRNTPAPSFGADVDFSSATPDASNSSVISSPFLTESGGLPSFTPVVEETVPGSAPVASVLPLPTPTATPKPTPVPTPYCNPYPADKNEAKLADAGKAFMKKLTSQPLYSSLNLRARGGYPYLICVNKVMNCVTVYCVDENGNYTRPFLSMVCSGGKATPLGVFNTPHRYSWHTLMGPCYGQYCTRIVDGVLFHSVPYYTMHKYDLEYKSYNKLGKTVSHGCVRLAVNDAKWIFDNCPIGTTVVIYDDKSDAGPLGKPKPIKLDVDNIFLRGWDPTDPDPANPWGDEFRAGTTHRSALAQEQFDKAMASGAWNGSINRPEAPTPTPNVTPTPEFTPTPELTETPAVSETPAYSGLPFISATPYLPETPSATAAPVVSDTPQPTPSLEPTLPPEPTQPPDPVRTVEPTNPIGILPPGPEHAGLWYSIRTRSFAALAPCRADSLCR